MSGRGRLVIVRQALHQHGARKQREHDDCYDEQRHSASQTHTHPVITPVLTDDADFVAIRGERFDGCRGKHRPSLL